MNQCDVDQLSIEVTRSHGILHDRDEAERVKIQMKCLSLGIVANTVESSGQRHGIDLRERIRWKDRDRVGIMGWRE